MPDKPNNPYKQLVTVLPLIGAFLVFLGVLKLDIYYSHFDINIVDYLAFSEILTSFLDDINIILFCIVLMLLHTLLGSVLLIRVLTKLINKSREHEVSQKTIEKSITQKQRRPFGIILAVVFSGLSFWLLFYFQKTWILYIAILFSFQLVLLILELLNRLTVRMSDDFLYKPALVLLFLLFTYTIAQLEVIRAETHPYTAEITTDSGIITTTIDNFLIGKTDKYLFIHNKRTNSNQIIPTDRIQTMTIKYETDTMAN